MARSIYVNVCGARYIAAMDDDGTLRSLHLPGDYLEAPRHRFSEEQWRAAAGRARFAWQLRQGRATT